MAREQTRDPQQQHATATMLAKQACALTLKLLPVVTRNSTDSIILPGKAPELISIIERTMPWTLRLVLLQLVCELQRHQKLQLLMGHGGTGLDCLHGWFQAASNTAEEAKREALQLALLQTFASLARAHCSLVQPWMLMAAYELAASSPLHTVRDAAMKFERAFEIQAGLLPPEEISSASSDRLTYAALSPMLHAQDSSSLEIITTTVGDHEVVCMLMPYIYCHGLFCVAVPLCSLTAVPESALCEVLSSSLVCCMITRLACCEGVD